MTDEKYIQNQKDFIMREWKYILRDHLKWSGVLLVLLAFMILLAVGAEHPDSWQETTITLERVATVRTGKGGSRLDIYDTEGNRYVINRNEGQFKGRLAVGQQYTFTYSDNLLHNNVEVIQIGDVSLRYEDSVERYREHKIVLWGLAGFLTAGLIAYNVIIYQAGTGDRIKRIRKYRKRISDKKGGAMGWKTK